jgi:hypothetical protein
MTTVAEIENAMKVLPFADKLRLLNVLGETVAKEQKVENAALHHKTQSHSVLDIPVVSVGRVLRPDFQRGDLLEEMLGERI